MAITRKHVQDAIKKLDAELVKVLIERQAKFIELAKFDSDPMQSVGLLDNAVAAARKAKGDAHFINTIFSDLNLRFGHVELMARVDASIVEFKKADADVLVQRGMKGKKP